MTRLCLVAGGTGGHIFPALAFAEWLERSGKVDSLSFVCGNRPLEREIYSSRNIHPMILPLSGSPFGTAGIYSRYLRWKETLFSYLTFRKWLRKEEWDCCVLFGGYVSFVPLLACHLGRALAIAHEQNAAAGKVTRLARRLGKKIASGWEECFPLEEGSFFPVGVPVRPFTAVSKEVGWRALNTGREFPENRIIGVMGGSLMSERLIQLSCSVVTNAKLRNTTFLLLGARGTEVEDHLGQNPPENVILLEKQWNMNGFYSVIDGAVARGGASTLYELASLEIPAVIVPWKYAADDHQKKNAQCFKKQNAGEVWQEDEPLELLVDKILQILKNERPFEKTFSEGDESEHLWRLISSSIGREIHHCG